MDLLKSGAHFGHDKSRWNPKMKGYIFTTRGNIHILDLEKTRNQLLKAASHLTDAIRKGHQVMFVGTKKQLRESVKEAAEAVNIPYVNLRWLGGTFTNFKTIQKTIRKWEKLQLTRASQDFAAHYTKKERLMIEREIEKMERLFSGIKDMRRLPEIMFVTDINHDALAVKEAKKMGVKVIGLIDTNSNPGHVDVAIPCNDDSAKAVKLVLEVLSEAIAEGKKAHAAATAQQAQK